jgi:hypothetical protein
MEKGDFDPSEASREAFRAAKLGKLSARYSPAAHLIGETAAYVAVVASALAALDGWRFRDLWAAPAAFVIANVFEWALHRFVMHERRPPRFIYEAHTQTHHRIYRHHDMPLRSWRELPFVLFGARTLIGVIAMAFMNAATVWWLIGRNAGLVFLAAEASYVLLYELLHLSFHLPAGHPVRRLPIVRWLDERHRRHHDPRLMRSYNFNVTFPLADALFRTSAPD